MRKRSVARGLGLVVLAALAVALFRPWLRASAEGRASDKGGALERAGDVGARAKIADAPPSGQATSMATSTPLPSDPTGAFATMAWGTGARELGHKRPDEGNPEGPMSLAVDARGEALIVDQVNAELVRLGPDGALRGRFRIGEGAQDVAVASDGTVAVLDRLVDRAVTLYTPEGKAIGALPLQGKGIAEGGQVTGVFLDGASVYVEREHGKLVRIGGTNGDVGGERSEIPGRPSRDGSSFVSAFLEGGKAYVSAITRKTMEHRYTRALPLVVPARSILLLDTDRRGTLYVATLSDRPDGSESEFISCSALSDGRALGVVEVTPNTMPEETFREFAVMEDGGVLHAELGDQGMTYVRYDCR